MARRRGREVDRRGEIPRALVLDAEGLSKAAAGDPRVRAYIARARELDADIVVSTLTLTETLRGKPADAAIHRLLEAADRQPVTEAIGREAGELLGQTERRDTVDAVIAVTARSLQRSVLVLTSDPGDLTTLTGNCSRVNIVSV